MIWYYDNGDELPSVSGGEAQTPHADDEWLDVERVYHLDWHRFVDDDWHTLWRIYGSLPGWQSVPDGELPRWYSLDEERHLHLWASVEPSGLQVGGVLTVGMWREWDERFRRAVGSAALPRFRCE